MTTSRDPSFAYDVAEGTPLVIDNGSYRCRAGWSTDAAPRLEFVNQSARYRQRRDGEPLFTVGGDINLGDWSRLTYRTPFEGGVVCNFDSQELVLDHVFSHLNIDSRGAGRVNHPIVMTEALCNPNYCREGVNELMFECYGVPSVSYAVDALCSYYHSQQQQQQQQQHLFGLKTGLILSISHRSTHIIPVTQPNACDVSNAKRINVGGLNMATFLMRMMHLKHPVLARDMTYGAYESMLHEHCYIAGDYADEIRQSASREGLAKIERPIQLPFDMQVASEKSAEEKEKSQQRRKEHAQRLAQLATVRRAEKLKAQEDLLSQYTDLVESKASIPRNEFQEQLQALDFKTETQLSEAIKALQAKVKLIKSKQQGGPEEPEEEKESVASRFDFSLLEMNDADLTDEQIKEKRKLRLIKGGIDARERAKAAKLVREKEAAEEALKEEQLRENDFATWKKNYMQKRQGLMDKIRDRKRKREQLADRRSVASIQRMRSIAALAEGHSDDKPQRKRRAVQASSSNNTNHAEDDDTFGADDNDWLVYRQISKEEDSDEEEDELTQLAEVETLLSKFDPDFDAQSTNYGQEKGLLSAYQNGFGEGSTIAEQYQMHLNVERIRAPEMLFQPWTAGIDQAGIAQCIQSILSAYSSQQQLDMCKNVYITGGLSLLPGIEERLRNELLQMRPFQSEIAIRRAADPLRDAWRGARAMAAQTESLPLWSVSRQSYDEQGHDYLVEHALSNRYHRIPQ